MTTTSMLIGQVAGLSFVGYTATAWPCVLAGLLVAWGTIVVAYRGRFGGPVVRLTVESPPFDAWQSGKGLTALVLCVALFIWGGFPRENVALACAGCLLLSRRMGAKPKSREKKLRQHLGKAEKMIFFNRRRRLLPCKGNAWRRPPTAGSGLKTVRKLRREMGCGAEAFRHRCGARTSNPVERRKAFGRFDPYTLPPSHPCAMVGSTWLGPAK